MKQGQDISAEFPGIVIVHQKIRGNSKGDHDHEEHEIFFPLQGEIRIETGGDTLKAGPGKMLYLPPANAHSFHAGSSTQGERLILLVQPRAWNSNGGGRFGPRVVSASQLCKELLFHLLIHPNTRVVKPLIETLVQTLSEMLEESAVPGGEVKHLAGKSADPRIHKALEYLAQNFTNKVPAEALGRAAGMSQRTLNRLFLTELGMTPKQVLTLHRIDRAKKVLKAGTHSVTDAAFEAGYQSVSQFITTFRTVTGQVPSDFLRS